MNTTKARFRAYHLSIIAVVSLVLVACAPSAAPNAAVFRPQVTATVTDWIVDAPKAEVIDAILNLGQQNNLSVHLLDRQSGLIDFEVATIDAAMLDDYCYYPLLNSDGSPNDTFRGWHSRSINAGGGPVFGLMAISVLVSPAGSNSSLRIRTNFEAHNSAEGSACQGTGQFDTLAVQAVRELVVNKGAKAKIGLKKN